MQTWGASLAPQILAGIFCLFFLIFFSSLLSLPLPSLSSLFPSFSLPLLVKSIYGRIQNNSEQFVPDSPRLHPNCFYVANTLNRSILKYDVLSDSISTLLSRKTNSPSGIFYDETAEVLLSIFILFYLLFIIFLKCYYY